MKKIYIIFAVASCILVFWILIHHDNMQHQNLRDRIISLEKQTEIFKQKMREKNIPIIKVERATIYNGNGEVIIVEEKNMIREGKK